MPLKSLKRGVHLRTRTFVAASGLTLLWVAVGMPVEWLTLKTLPTPSWLHSAAIVLLTLIASALSSAPGDQAKASLVFLRVRDPLPGSRAFEEKELSKDPRIDQQRLRALLGGSFPRSPGDQNARWHRLYKDHEADVRVSDAHFEYLLFRDLTWLALLFCVASLVASAIIPENRTPLLILGAIFFMLTALFRQAGSARGVRLVNTVLALASSTPLDDQNASAIAPATPRRTP